MNDGSDNRDDDSGNDNEDRDVILARRKMLVASAVAGLGMGLDGCDWISEKLGRTAPFQPCLDVPPPPQPQPCLNVAATPCLAPIQVQPYVEDAAAAPMPCLSEAAPRVCLSRTVVRPPTAPQPLPRKSAPDDES